MDHERELWRDAARAAELSAEELDLVALACELAGDLEGELTVIFAVLRMNLSGPFLRRFVDRLDPLELGGAELSVMPALREAIGEAALAPVQSVDARRGGRD